jgi:hypothetical protein
MIESVIQYEQLDYAIIGKIKHKYNIQTWEQLRCHRIVRTSQDNAGAENIKWEFLEQLNINMSRNAVPYYNSPN